MKAKFTPGALRAAKFLDDAGYIFSWKREDVTHIIDRETHAPEMYGLLEKLLTLAAEPEKAGDRMWPCHLGNIIENARRLKAEIDGE